MRDTISTINEGDEMDIQEIVDLVSSEELSNTQKQLDEMSSSEICGSVMNMIAFD